MELTPRLFDESDFSDDESENLPFLPIVEEELENSLPSPEAIMGRRLNPSTLRRRYRPKPRFSHSSIGQIDRTRDFTQNPLPVSPKGSRLSQSLPPSSIFAYFNAPTQKKTPKPSSNAETESKESEEKAEEFEPVPDASVRIDDEVASVDIDAGAFNFQNDLRFDYDMFKQKFRSRHKLKKTPLYWTNAALLYRIVLFPLCQQWWIERLSLGTSRILAILYVVQICVTALWYFEFSQIDYVEVGCPLVLFLSLIVLLLFCVNMDPKLLEERKKERIMSEKPKVVLEVQRPRVFSMASLDSGHQAEMEESEDDEKSELMEVNDITSEPHNIITQQFTGAEIARAIYSKVNKAEPPSWGTYYGVVVCLATACLPFGVRMFNCLLCPAGDCCNYAWASLSCIVSSYILSQRIMNELLVGENYLFRKYLLAKYFRKISSKSKANKANLPYFRLDSPNKIYEWTKLRFQISNKELLEQKSSTETISFVSHVAVGIWSLLMMKNLFVEDLSMKDIFFNLPGAIFGIWLLTLSLFAVRYSYLYYQFLRKKNPFVLLHSEIVNLSLDLGNKNYDSPEHKAQLSSSIDILKQLIILLKMAEPEGKIKTKRTILNSHVFEVFSLLLLSYFSSALYPMLGYKPKLHKIGFYK